MGIGYASEAIWKGKIGLIDATEYVRASTNSSCTNMYAGKQGNCGVNNWMYTSSINYLWTMSPGSSYTVWIVSNNSELGNRFAIIASSIRPVLTLNSNIQITGGTGTSSSPYTLGV